MSIVWVIERSNSNALSAAGALMGDFPVRVFGSPSSFHRLARLKNKVLPDVLIVDADEWPEALASIRKTIDSHIPGVASVYLSAGRTGTKEPMISVAKPIDALALSRLVRHLGIQQARARPPGVIKFRDVELDLNKLTYRVVPSGTDESLPMKEARILTLLIKRTGECLSRDIIRQELWEDVQVTPRTIDSHISRLRKRLAVSEVEIESVYGGGYILR